MFEFIKVMPNYIGNGVYMFTGQLKSGEYFLGFYKTLTDLRVALFPETVWTRTETKPRVKILKPLNWIEDNMRGLFTERETREFFKDMLAFCLSGKPKGNYVQFDLELLLQKLSEEPVKPKKKKKPITPKERARLREKQRRKRARRRARELELKNAG